VFFALAGFTAILGILGMIVILGTFISNRRRDPALVELMQKAKPVIKQIQKDERQGQAIDPLSVQDKKGQWWNFNPVSQNWSVFDGTYWHPIKAPFKGFGKSHRLPYFLGGFLVLTFVIFLLHVLIVWPGPNYSSRISFLGQYMSAIQEFTSAFKLPF
jgi:hypothetical protein